MAAVATPKHGGRMRKLSTAFENRRVDRRNSFQFCSRMESWASWCCDMVTKQRRRRNTEKSKNRTSADYQLGFIGKETYLYTRSQVKSACTPLVSPQTIRKRVNKQNQNLYRQSRKATSFSCKHTEAWLMQASPSFVMCEASIISRLRWLEWLKRMTVLSSMGSHEGVEHDRQCSDMWDVGVPFNELKCSLKRTLIQRPVWPTYTRPHDNGIW